MKNKKSIVLAAVSAVAFASISVGTTFALFTSKAETDIEVSSGKINVNANLGEDDIKVYSAVFESETVYHEELQTETRVESGLTQHLFSNGGYAAYDATNSLFIIDRITPGDLVKFSFNVASDSNVKFKYRLSYVAVDTDEDPSTSYLDLVKGMDTTIKSGDSSVSYRGLAKYQTEWEIKDPAEELDDVEFTLSLPVEAGNQYQNKDAKILVSFEAVQANAYTDGDAEIVLVEENIASDPVVVVENEDTMISAESATSDLEFTVTVPQNVKYGDNETVSPTDVLTIEVTDLGKAEEVYSTETSLNFDLVVKVNGEEANNFSKPLPVNIYVGKGLIISSVKHNNTEVTVYDYDTETGYISFSTSSFSPFEVSFLEGIEVKDAVELSDALKIGGKIGIKKDITTSTFLEIKKDTTLIGLGHTITVNATRALRVQSNNVELNIGDLTLNGGSTCERGLQVDSNMVGVKVNLDNVNIGNVTHYAINLCGSCEVDMEINNSYITGWAAINAYGFGHNINVYNSKIEGVNNYSGTSNAFCTVCLEGDTTYQTDDHCADYVIKFVNCELSARRTGDQPQSILGFNTNATNCSISFVNCTYEVSEGCHGFYDISCASTEQTTNSVYVNGEQLVYTPGYYYNFQTNA